MENHKRPLARAGRLWFWGVRLWFSGGDSFGLFEGGWFCPLSFTVWGWLGCVVVEGGVGVGGASLPEKSWGFLLRGAGSDFSVC